MDSARRLRVEALFEQLVEEPASERQWLLKAACSEDPEVGAELTALLEADGDCPPILNQDAATLACGLLEAGSDPALPDRLGRYVLHEYLGEGGMGSVYLAEREDLGDRVALKLLHDPWSSPSRRRRFASEQMTLASLSHRHIARLYDAGTTSGRPWIAMEYVPGTSIVQYARHNHLGLQQRLRLFRAACEAVSYAHRNLTVHLDLKPSNVLVSSDGEVKLVDFGIARHLPREGGEAERTTTGLRLLSMNYASPEQIRGEAVDVQTDVYALGVILYELLAGRLPSDLTNVSAAALARVLEEEPERPSVAATRHDGAAVCASRAQWNDLDVLCLTAVRRDRAERYETVDRLMRDLDHFLADEPLEARTDRFRCDRMRKFLSRNRRPVAAAAGVFVAVATLVVFFNVQLLDARDRAVASEARMQRIHRLMLNLFEGDDSSAGPAEGLRVVSLLDRGVREADGMKGEPELQAELRYTFGGLYHKLGHLDRADPLLLSAWQARKVVLGLDDPQTIRAQLALAFLRLDQSRRDEAEVLVRESLDTARLHSAPGSTEVAIATGALGKVLASQGDYRAAIPLLEKAVQVLEQGPASIELSEVLGDLANTQYYLGLVDAADAVVRRGLALDLELFGPQHPNVAIGLYNLGNIQLDHANYVESERLYRQALAINETWYAAAHPRTASSLLMLGRSLAYQGHLDEAATLYQQALLAMRAVYGERHARFASVLSLMGDLAVQRRELDDAERHYRHAATVFKDTSGERHEFYVHQLSNLGAVLVIRGQHARAEELLRRAVELLTAAVPDQRYTGLAQVRLAGALVGQGRYAEAEHHALAGYRTLQKVTSSSAAEQQDARRELRRIYAGLGQAAKVQELGDELARHDGRGGTIQVGR